MTSTASSRPRPLYWAQSDIETGRRHSGPSLSLPDITRQMFHSPAAAGRKITAGFSYVQRIGKSGTADVWFPEQVRDELDARLARGTVLGAQDFPAEWAAVRQFELLHESGNYKVFDMRSDYITRTFRDLASHMRAGGYRITVATVGRYVEPKDSDDLAILDQRLQKRIARLIHMMYLDEQSDVINQMMDKALAEKNWSFHSALPHIGANLGAHDLFRPSESSVKRKHETVSVPMAPHQIRAVHDGSWINDLGVADASTGQPFIFVTTRPESGQYQVSRGHYQFSASDTGREVTLHYTCKGRSDDVPHKLSDNERRHRLSKLFFRIIDQLPHKHIVHDTAVGLQLPESINENEWIYLTQSEDTLWGFNSLLNDLFRPFDGMSLSRLDGRSGAGNEIKASMQHMRGYGDRLSPQADQHYRGLTQYTM